MTWQPASIEDLRGLIDSATTRMRAQELRLWELVRISPAKWVSHPFGDLGGGFWAVGVVGQTVIWFNDIEDGFNASEFSVWGTIDGYRVDQAGLESVIQSILLHVEISPSSDSLSPDAM